MSPCLLRSVGPPHRACWLPAVLFALVGLSSQPAAAMNVGYTLDMSASNLLLDAPNDPVVKAVVAWTDSSTLAFMRNNPYFDLTNTSDTADLARLTFGIGNLDFGWNNLQIISSPGVGVTANLLDGNKTLELLFTDFGPQERVRFRAQLPPDAPTPPPHDFRTILFDLNGSDDSNNSPLGVTFTDEGFDDLTLERRLPDFPQQGGFAPGTFFSYGQMDVVHIFSTGDTGVQDSSEPGGGGEGGEGNVPEPGSLLLLSLALLWCVPRYFRARPR